MIKEGKKGWSKYLKEWKRKNPYLYQQQREREREKRLAWYKANGKPKKAPKTKTK